jgi:hypothetical protein
LGFESTTKNQILSTNPALTGERMPQGETPREGQILTGSLFSEPMRVETVRPSSDGTWVLGLVGVQSERFRKVTLRSEDLKTLSICATEATLQEPIRDPAKFPWREVTKVAHYWLEVNAMTKPMQVREDQPPYGGNRP